MTTFVVFAPSDRIENEKSLASFDAFQDVVASRTVRVQEAAAPVLSAVAKLGEEAGVARVRDAANVSLMEIGHSEMMSGDAVDGPDPLEAVAATSKVNMLPAVGGLILQDAKAEEVARLRDAGFEVVENKRYYYVPPEPVAADGMAADAGAAHPAEAWHLGHCGALGMHAAGFDGQGSCIGSSTPASTRTTPNLPASGSPSRASTRTGTSSGPRRSIPATMVPMCRRSPPGTVSGWPRRPISRSPRC